MTPLLAALTVSDIALAAALVIAVASAGIAVRGILTTRRLRARMVDAVNRLGLVSGSVIAGDGIDDVLSIVESAVRDQRQNAEQRRADVGRLQEALDALPLAVMVVDSSGTVLDRNIAAGVFIEARHSDALIGGVVNELVTEALAGRPAQRTLELFGPPRRAVVVTARPLGVAGVACAVAVIEDITERRRLEAVRTDFVANISHELKTPIGAIGLLAETLQAEDDPEVADRLARRIQMESYRVGRSIEDLLELSRIEIDETRVADVVEIGSILDEAADRLRPAAEQAKVTIEVFGAELDDALRCDRRQMVSALTNLLDNAIKYSDPQGRIEIRGAVSAEDVVFSVTDHGIGIPARDLDRVFERFYRVDQARSRQTGGTGLGLAIVRHVAVNHAGTVEVESRLGEGSTFKLRLPLSLLGAHEHTVSDGASPSNDQSAGSDSSSRPDPSSDPASLPNGPQ
ncbi:MAG: two-component sensor histidine kinase [Actinobacteria bacterium]|uniref:histidine kinase n=1 Tax=freshwater metagenome TaxID=449393 RepID=A0A6J5Y9F0_9ZZZZ|nr:two-component sensor histidine kinase [Actinomycetota bacterium]MTA77152.1 two-component sensor histidine kinase [Actinomycetota bacterium]